LDIVGAGGSGIKANGLGYNEGDGFCFNLSACTGRTLALAPSVEKLVSKFMNKGGEFLGSVKPLLKGDLSAGSSSMIKARYPHLPVPR